jgi:DNA-binding SARP family transcriptional activator/tetratricopeptide (TPR) repeat protein
MAGRLAVVEFGLLGPLLLCDDGQDVLVSARRQRVLLAALLLEGAGRVVAFDDLADLVWDGQPPTGARGALHSAIGRLRATLGPAGPSLVRTRAPGYLIDIDANDVDVHRFGLLARQGEAAASRRRWAQASGLLSQALALWRGEPLADISSVTLRDREVPPLAEQRLWAVSVRIDADLHLGRHEVLVPELARLTGDYPLREGFHRQFMLALYRAGRLGDALTAYRRVRQSLIDELGAEPGPELQDLHQRILAGDTQLTATEQGPGTSSVEQYALRATTDGHAGPLGGGSPRRAFQRGAFQRADFQRADFERGELAPAPRRTVPRQLPADPAHFTGRAAELNTLTGWLDEDGAGGMVVICAVGGTAGVGKTALAVHWAHRVAGRFPDGQLYVNLRGFGPASAPADPAEAIHLFLETLGADRERIPVSLDGRVAMYRSLLADKRVLIVLDNARDASQVRPLLPASPGCLVIVTSRRQLAGLAAAEAARLVNLDVLTAAEARELLTRRLGPERAATEPGAVDQIARLCAHLPLALVVAAARAAYRPGFPLAVLAAELTGPLDVLDAGDPDSGVQTVFSWSTGQLNDQAGRMFRLLGIHPGPDITVAAAASLAAITETGARRLLGELARANLITEHLPGRYAFHDLLHAYAAEQARQTDSDSDRHQATGRMLDHYLHTAAHAALLLMPAREPVVLAPPRQGAAAGQPVDRSQALAWFEAEHQVLLAAVTLAAGSGFDSHAWQLPWAMASFLQIRGHWQDCAATQRTALAAATRLGDTAAQALCGRLLAIAYSNLGDQDQALGQYTSSLTLCQQLGNRLGQAKIHQNLGVLAEHQGRYADALGHAEQALRLFKAIGDKASEADALNSVGWSHGLLGDYQQARAFCRQSVVLCAEADNRWAEGSAWDSVGYAEHNLGNLAEAAACYQRALSLHREFGARFDEAGTLIRLGDTRHAVGEPTQARDAWQQALTILEDLHHPDAEQVRAKLSQKDITAH